eukprot:TRINITY_DN108973_c0_g1_i1.p1 TRINITY_DN108973_c0_g1~~TRINITY_DN108973_c0_g1_i1.p1  ORF type:complete len:262 (+),score=58.55 TRINITY_DN108973_c0_g1_i1:38-787(+)
MAAAVARLRPWQPRAGGGLGAACRSPFQLRCFAWENDKPLNFKVKAEGVDMNKLAGAVAMRCQNRQQTFLDAMGEKSIYNCVKALVVANKFAEYRRADTAFPEKVPWYDRVGFIPMLRKDGTNEWVSLRVVPLEKPPETPPSSSESMKLKISANTPVLALQKAILNEWLQRCSGSKAEPRLATMGGKGVSSAVKSSALCLAELSKRKGAARLFLCYPEMVQEKLEGKDETVTMTYLRLEPRPMPVVKQQ